MSPIRSRSGGSGDWHHLQPVEQVFPELAGLHVGIEVPVGGGDDTYIDANIRQATDALEGLLLQKPQEF